MKWIIPLSATSFGSDEHDALRRVLESGWVSMGPETVLLEEEFSAYLRVKHAIAVSSGTAALHLALLGLGVGPGDEVIVPALTFVATANAVVYTGATPVFADITSLHDWNISPRDIEHKVTTRTKAIIAVHYAGFACQMKTILEIANRHGLEVIEDAAHAPGATFNGKKLGTVGSIGCFSFFANKNMTTAEGGLIVTNDDTVAQRMRMLRSHGMTSLTWDRHRGHGFSYDVVETGYNYRMDELRAALGRVQLRKLEKNNKKRKGLALTMRSVLRDVEGLALPFSEDSLENSSCHIFPVLLDNASLRSAFMEHLKQVGIQTSIHYPPVHRFSVFARQFQLDSPGLPWTDQVACREVTLPLYPDMSLEQVDMLCVEVTRALHLLNRSEVLDQSGSVAAFSA
jgi:dTDP-4-amino-4,6-dideoxygalactose transaminase